MVIMRLCNIYIYIYINMCVCVCVCKAFYSIWRYSHVRNTATENHDTKKVDTSDLILIISWVINISFRSPRPGLVSITHRTPYIANMSYRVCLTSQALAKWFMNVCQPSIENKESFSTPTDRWTSTNQFDSKLITCKPICNWDRHRQIQ